MKCRGRICLCDCFEQTCGRVGRNQIQAGETAAIAEPQAFSRNLMLAEPELDDREARFIIATFAVLARIRIGRGGAAFFSQRT